MKRILFLIMLLVCAAPVARAQSVSSPDGRITLDFAVLDAPNCTGCMHYKVAFNGAPVIAPSRLGLDLADGSKILDNFFIASSQTASRDSTWSPVYGERSTVRDQYNELSVVVNQSQAPRRELLLTFRAYDAGVAFRYTIQGGGDISIAAENTQFRFLRDHLSWQAASAQGVYEKKPLSRMWVDAERPLTVQVDEQLYAAVGEAALVDYARMRLGMDSMKPPVMISRLAGPVAAALPLTTPWRVILLAESPGKLLENNDIFLNLNEPSQIQDTTWIKPGKVLREVTLTTDGGLAAADFAARHNMQYIMFDAGWYGPENDDASDAATVTLDPARSAGPLDLQAVISYAAQRGVGVILYVNHRALEKQLDEILPLYKKWGVKGIKFGFVNVGPQEWTAWLHEAVRKAAAYEMLVDIHDEYRPTGWSRTWPNLLTQEGIGGDETSPSNEQTLNILFTRMLAGAADNTFCYFDSRVDKNATHAYQLAKAVAIYSPLQFLYWYDRPENAPRKAGGAGGEMNIIRETPELEFWDALPTVWDDTRVLRGAIGEYAVIARRSGDQWFIGAMNAGPARSFDAPLDFLDADKQYTAHIYSDDPAVQTATHVRIDRKPVAADTVLTVTMAENGGQAVRIEPNGSQ
jgi:alpha-glucosidase